MTQSFESKIDKDGKYSPAFSTDDAMLVCHELRRIADCQEYWVLNDIRKKVDDDKFNDSFGLKLQNLINRIRTSTA